MRRIYFDHNATTPLDERALAAMTEAATRFFANPSSLHEEGRAARQVVEQARTEVAALVGASPAEIVFTSGGSESNNSAILGALRGVATGTGARRRIVSSPLEHPSVRALLQELASSGHPVTLLPVDSAGRIDPAELERVLAAGDTRLVTLSLCNHELGNLYPIAELCRLSHAHGALFHCDAVQAVGRVPVSVAELGVDLLSVSAHKLHGPKGIGALFVRAPSRERTARGLPALGELPPLLRGGAQEKGRRAGTENVPGIAGFGTAAAIARRELDRSLVVAALRDRLEAGLLTLPGARRHGDGSPGARAPGTANLAFAGVEGELVFMNLDLRGIAVSTGSACSSGSPEPSPVLLALGLDRRQALEGVRFSIGRANTAEEVDQVIAAVTESLALVRGSRSSVHTHAQ